MKDSGMAAKGAFFEVLVGEFLIDGQELHSILAAHGAAPHGEEQYKRIGVLLIMHYTLMLLLALSNDQDSLIAEIHALRMELQNTAATIQRVQIVMYRLQAQSYSLEKATGRLDMARGQCKQAQDQQKFTVTQIEQMKKQGSQNGPEQRNVEEAISRLQAQMEMWVSQAQQCQGEQADAENQFRLEQAKMSELEGQLEQLDRVLAARGK